MKKFLYINEGSNAVRCYPAKSFYGGHPTSDTVLRLFFAASYSDTPGRNSDIVDLTIAANRHYNVLNAIYEAISTSAEPMIILADDDESTYLISHITAVAVTTDTTTRFSIGWNGHRSIIKILPSDFVADDVGRPVMIDDTGSDRWVESHGTAKLFASIAIPFGFTATHVTIEGSATSAMAVYEADIDAKAITSRGTGNIGTTIDITDVISDGTNYLLIELQQASGEEVYGGTVVIIES